MALESAFNIVFIFNWSEYWYWLRPYESHIHGFHMSNFEKWRVTENCVYQRTASCPQAICGEKLIWNNFKTDRQIRQNWFSRELNFFNSYYKLFICDAVIPHIQTSIISCSILVVFTNFYFALFLSALVAPALLNLLQLRTFGAK